MYGSVRSNRELVKLVCHTQRQRRCLSNSAPLNLPMKPGTPIAGLDFFKGKDPPVSLKREEYPEWVNDLTTPLLSLAKLRKMPESEATDRDKMRYLKLKRRLKMKENNSAAEAD